VWDRFLSGRWCIAIAALLGMLLVAPALNSGLMGDDYLHWSLLTERGSNAQPGSSFGLFTFADGDVARNQAMIDSGQLVWWASPNLRISFWRPVAEWSQWIDYRFWPESPVLAHLHSLLLYGVMVLLVGKLFKELSDDTRSSNFATLLFAGNMLHGFAVAWLACRNQMLSGILLTLTLLSYHRWRSGRSLWHAVLAALSLIVGLLSAEASIQAAAYLFAYALFMERGKPLFGRFAALVPFAIIVLVWKATHGQLGYGSFGSPGYVDPSSNPVGFLGSLALRLPALMLAQWFGVSSVAFELLSRETQIMYATAATVALLALAYAIHRLDGFKTPLARFFALGSVLALVPACAGYPFDRLTLNSDIGASGLLAIVLLSVWARRKQLSGGAVAAMKYLVLVVGFIHVVIFPVAKLGISVIMKPVNTAGEKAVTLAMPKAIEGQEDHFLLVNTPSAEATYYMPLTRQYHGMANPTTIRALGPDYQAMTMTRLDDVSLRLLAPQGFKGTITRDFKKEPFKAGDTVKMGDIGVRVDAVNARGVPTDVVFRFPDSIDNAKWHFLMWTEDGVARMKPPAPGQSREIAPYDIQKVAMKYMN
jgi:hypothetical protein